MPDVVSSFTKRKVASDGEKLLSKMIYAGKELYLKDLLPDYTDG
jgi:hypothetical protein